MNSISQAWKQQAFFKVLWSKANNDICLGSHPGISSHTRDEGFVTRLHIRDSEISLIVIVSPELWTKACELDEWRRRPGCVNSILRELG